MEQNKTEEFIAASCPQSQPTSPYSRNKAEIKKENLKTGGSKLVRRKLLFNQRRKVSDMCVILAMVGIILMIINTELAITKMKIHQDNDTGTQIFLKWMVTVSTILLMVFLLLYHKIDIELFTIDKDMDDWRLAMTMSRVLLIGLELFVCSLHPLPTDNYVTLINLLRGGSKQQYQPTQANVVPVNIILSIPMFLRFYLICRTLMLHSQIYQDASAQSLGALNKIEFDFAFIFKSLMNLYSEYVLTIMITFLFFWASWSVRACECYNRNNPLDFFESMWLIAITFLTVGYGDLVPSTTCGKAISVMTGMFGVGCTALVVAILARKLEFSRAEMYVHNFVIGVELAKQIKHAAANVLREGWLAHKYRKLNKLNRAMKHERRLLQAIGQIREIKGDQSRLRDNTISIVELYRLQNDMEKTIEATHTLVQQIHHRLTVSNEQR